MAAQEDERVAHLRSNAPSSRHHVHSVRSHEQPSPPDANEHETAELQASFVHSHNYPIPCRCRCSSDTCMRMIG